ERSQSASVRPRRTAARTARTGRLNGTFTNACARMPQDCRVWRYRHDGRGSGLRSAALRPGRRVSNAKGSLMRFTKVLLVSLLLALVVTPIALAIRFTDESYNPPVGETGKAYNWSFTGAAGCGPALPYQYRILDGAPPPG